ncbi:MAG: hypothetical protein ACW990_16175 [Promethearchaeota archaeon]|jgi:hypothetical protein
MKIKKIPIRPNKIGIDLILCPKTTLYLQDLYCRRCGSYEEDDEKYVHCSFSGHKFGQSDPVKDRIINDLSKSFITELPINKTKTEAVNIPQEVKISEPRPYGSKAVPVHFTENLKSSKVLRAEKEAGKTGLSQYIQRTNLTTHLEKIKESSPKKVEETE